MAEATEEDQTLPWFPRKPPELNSCNAHDNSDEMFPNNVDKRSAHTDNVAETRSSA